MSAVGGYYAYSAMDALCLAAGCTWKKTPYFYWLLPRTTSVADVPYAMMDGQAVADKGRSPRIQNLWVNTNLGQILNDMAADADVMLIVDPTVSGRLVADFESEDLPLEVALVGLCRQTNTVWKKTPYYYCVTTPSL